MARWKPALGLGSFLLLAVAFRFLAMPYVQRFRLGAGAVAGIYSCFLVLLILALVPGVKALRPKIQSHSMLLPILWLLPYGLYAVGTGDFRWLALARLVGISLPVALIYRFLPVRDPVLFAWQDGFVAFWLIGALLGHQLAGIWNVPANLDFMGRLFLIAIAGGSWVFVRPVPELGFKWHFSWLVGRTAALSFLGFAVFAIPAGLALGFIRWNPLHKGVLDFGIAFLEIFLFIALLEELFFRGFLQTLLSASLGSKRTGHVVASLVFGLFHILHAPFPNWRYVILASVAGWFYGWAFMKSGTLTASALTHAMVDTVWRTFFSTS